MNQQLLVKLIFKNSKTFNLILIIKDNIKKIKVEISILLL